MTVSSRGVSVGLLAMFESRCSVFLGLVVLVLTLRGIICDKQRAVRPLPKGRRGSQGLGPYALVSTVTLITAPLDVMRALSAPHDFTAFFLASLLMGFTQVKSTISAALPAAEHHAHLPDEGFVRLSTIIGPGGPIPVSKSTCWLGVKTGRFPRPIKLARGITVWRVVDIRALFERRAANDSSSQ